MFPAQQHRRQLDAGLSRRLFTHRETPGLEHGFGTEAVLSVTTAAFLAGCRTGMRVKGAPEAVAAALVSSRLVPDDIQCQAVLEWRQLVDLGAHLLINILAHLNRRYGMTH